MPLLAVETPITPITPSGWIAIAVTATVFLVMVMRRGVPTDLLFLGSVVVVTLFGVISPEKALAGFANPGVLTIGALFVVSAGLRATGVLDRVGNQLLGPAKTVGQAFGRLMACVLSISAFIMNTAVVAMFVPIVLDWCRRRGVSPSRLLIPLSYVAIMGSTCTLIGTSTNIIVNGLLKDEYRAEERRIVEDSAQYDQIKGFHEQLRPMWLFEIGCVGLPCAIVGSLYLWFIGRRLLPDRTDMIEQLDEQRREYLVEMLVQPECRLVGKTVEEAGLRHLRGLFLLEINREGEVLTPVTPNDTLRAGDRLIFTGVVTTIVDLEKIPGLVPAADMTYEFSQEAERTRQLSEAVLSPSSPLIGTTVRRANFRRRYNAGVVAVHRNGKRMKRKIGDIVLEAGDTLLLQTRSGFTDRYRHSRDFYLVADVAGSEARQSHRAWLAVSLLLTLIVWLMATSWVGQSGPWAGLSSPALAGIAIAGLMIVGRCLPLAEARSSVDMHVLVTIAAALGLGQALTESGAAESLAYRFVGAFGAENPYILLILLYLLTVAFTETLSNAAVAIMLFPFGVAMAAAGGFSPRPFVMAIALAASLSFLSPIGYQTNLMVMGPGGYRPRDYLRVGWPLASLIAVVALTLIPLVWPFELASP
jgi:di/tricarboxylate transporter